MDYEVVCKISIYWTASRLRCLCRLEPRWPSGLRPRRGSGSLGWDTSQILCRSEALKRWCRPDQIRLQWRRPRLDGGIRLCRLGASEPDATAGAQSSQILCERCCSRDSVDDLLGGCDIEWRPRCDRQWPRDSTMTRAPLQCLQSDCCCSEWECDASSSSWWASWWTQLSSTAHLVSHPPSTLRLGRFPAARRSTLLLKRIWRMLAVSLIDWFKSQQTSNVFSVRGSCNHGSGLLR